MAKVGHKSGRLSRRQERGERGETLVADKKTGKTLKLKGYGALKGEYVVKAGMDLTKPIYAQARGSALRLRAVQRRERAKRRKS
jgi:hypothetical protein